MAQRRHKYNRDELPPASREFGRTLRQARELARISRAQLALKAGVSPACVQLVEEGETMPSLRVAEHLSEAVGRSLPETITESYRRGRS